MNLKDRTGKNFIPKSFLEKIAENSPVPIYSFWSSFLGSGTIGGYMSDGSVIAQNSLQNLLFCIKNGYFKKSKPIYKPFIDYEMLKKYKIEENLNPKDTTYINRAVPIWESYPKESLFTVFLIILLLLLLLLFFILKIRNDKIKKMEETIFLQSRQAVMGEMISVIAHQWRQPLNSIAAMVQTVRIKYLNEKLNNRLMEKFKNDTMKQIRYMSHTIDDFRNFYNVKKEKIDFNIKDELEKTIELIEFSYIKKHIKIEKSNFQNFMIKGYPNELLQSFLILFQNSKDVLAEKKIDNAYIKITMKIDNNKCIIIFEDNGGGIQEDIIDKIFTPYFSTKDIKSGTGIGLFMAKTIIEKHLNGVIVPSNTKVGAKFEIRLFSDR
jgi:signal transduction histidine kinase